jgi:hypothetical protein
MQLQLLLNSEKADSIDTIKTTMTWQETGSWTLLMKQHLSPFDGFTSHWLQMIHLIESTWYKRFTNIKEEIERLTVHHFPGQSVKDLSGAFLGKAKELKNHGFYEH